MYWQRDRNGRAFALNTIHVDLTAPANKAGLCVRKSQARTVLLSMRKASNENLILDCRRYAAAIVMNMD